MPELELPLAYSIPFDWGNFRVTEAADEAYGLIPLTPNIVKNGIDNPSDPNLPTEIVLIGPDEFDHEQGEVYVKHTVEKNAIKLAIGYGFTDKTLHEKISEDLTEVMQMVTGDESPDILDKFPVDDDIPASEVLRNQTGQMLVHSLQATIAEEAALATGLWLERDLARAHHKRITFLGSLSLLGGAVIIMPEIIREEHMVDPMTALLSLGFSGLWLNRTRQELKKILDSQGRQYVRSHALGQIAGSKVAEGIHTSYCNRRLNSELERQINGDEEPEAGL